MPGDNDSHDAEQARPPSGLSPVEAARRAVRRVYELTGVEPEGVTSLDRTDDGWSIGVEVVDLERIPSSNDLLAIYQVELDQRGRLASYRRTHRYNRGEVDRPRS